MSVVVKAEADDGNVPPVWKRPRRVPSTVVASVLLSPVTPRALAASDRERELLNVDWVNCWDSTKMQETLICARGCPQGVRKVPAMFVSNFSSEAEASSRLCLASLHEQTDENPAIEPI